MANEIQAVDRVAYNVVGALHKLFGFSYSRNTEQFVYQLTLDSTTAYAIGDTILGSLRISQEADFICTRVNVETRYLAAGTATEKGLIFQNLVAGEPSTVPVGESPQDVPYDVEITDGSTDRALQNEAVSARACYGMSGGLPGIWSKPRMFARNSNVTVKLTGLRGGSGDTAASLRTKVCFIGWKIYDAASLDLTTRRP